ncbi:MAG: DUF3054 domain-containing protein [Anaerolineales bacterium]|nr:DUF3054 domain-containing protein [Anaerolineales bacterium]
MNKKTTLLFGDVIVIAIVTLIGFATHDELSLQFLARMAAMFFPLAGAWIILGFWLNLFEPQSAANLKALWNVALATLFAVPLAFLVRGLLLNGMPIVPIVGVVFIGVTAVGLLLWRSVYYLYVKNK